MISFKILRIAQEMRYRCAGNEITWEYHSNFN